MLEVTGLARILGGDFLRERLVTAPIPAAFSEPLLD